tara:strand:+ start:10339 stop:10740 length:402 start_codon:yes stop_codon:yes gene_type:complete
MEPSDWKFVFRRRKWKLENYISDCLTVGDALDKFEKGGMSAPDTEDLVALGLKDTHEKSKSVSADSVDSVDLKAQKAPKRVDKPANVDDKPANVDDWRKSPPARTKKSSTKNEKKTKSTAKGYDELVVIETAE